MYLVVRIFCDNIYIMSSKSKVMSELQEKKEINELFELVNDPTFFIEMPNYQEKKTSNSKHFKKKNETR